MPEPALLARDALAALIDLAPTLLSVFLLGLTGSTHCVGMCGGIVAALSERTARMAGPASGERAGSGSAGGPGGASHVIMRVAGPRAMARHPRTALGARLAYNAGRIASYTLAGAIAGSAGSAAWLASHLLPVQQIAFAASSLVMILIGLHLARFQAPARALEGAGARLWPLLSPYARASLRLGGLPGALLAGAAWGWVPCGLVYGMLVAALVSASPLAGALIALAFGLGTLPALLALGWATERGLTSGRRRPALGRLVGLLLIAFALAGLARIDPLERLHQVGSACVNWLR